MTCHKFLITLQLSALAGSLMGPDRQLAKACHRCFVMSLHSWISLEQPLPLPKRCLLRRAQSSADASSLPKLSPNAPPESTSVQIVVNKALLVSYAMCHVHLSGCSPKQQTCWPRSSMHALSSPLPGLSRTAQRSPDAALSAGDPMPAPLAAPGREKLPWSPEPSFCWPAPCRLSISSMASCACHAPSLTLPADMRSGLLP